MQEYDGWVVLGTWLLIFEVASCDVVCVWLTGFRWRGLFLFLNTRRCLCVCLMLFILRS